MRTLKAPYARFLRTNCFFRYLSTIRPQILRANACCFERRAIDGALSLRCVQNNPTHRGFPLARTSRVRSTLERKCSTLNLDDRWPPQCSLRPEEAIAALTEADPKLGELIRRAGPFTMRLKSQHSPFEALVESIIYQQIHGKAAFAILSRLLTPSATSIPSRTTSWPRRRRCCAPAASPPTR